MKIDFTKISVPMNVAKTQVQVVNLKEAFADVVYQNGPGIAGANLALKIYNSDADTDYDEKEVQLIKNIACSCVHSSVMDGILSAINNPAPTPKG